MVLLHNWLGVLSSLGNETSSTHNACYNPLIGSKTMPATISVSTPSLETYEIQKGINRLGLTISEAELNELKRGNPISLEARRLSEIGSIFILAEALSAIHSVKKITFRDLPKGVTGSSGCFGAPIHCWDSDLLGKCWLVLTLEQGKPVVRILSQGLRTVEA